MREAAKRTLGQRHFDVQLMGGIVLHRGMIAEMKTGEGKTLVADAAGLPQRAHRQGRSRRHRQRLPGPPRRRMDGPDLPLPRPERRRASSTTSTTTSAKRPIACDITYGTNNEFGFDYLRDNMKFRLEEMVQRPFHYAIVDEVDSILIDEARTPLIISGPTEDKSELYIRVDKLIPALLPRGLREGRKAAHRRPDRERGSRRSRRCCASAGLMEAGNLYDIHNISLVHHVNQALRAHKLFARDTDYIVKDDKVVIIDEFTGRMMEGRRYSEGLHQALEAKEGVTVQNENQTLASITFQNYFRMYPKLAGMTGTAMTEAEEFGDIYKLEVIEIPTNVPVHPRRQRRRGLSHDAREVRGDRRAGRGVPGSASSRCWSAPSASRNPRRCPTLFKKHKIPHHVLNARYHEQEAYIIAQAGRPGAVTIATNMAGRGTDIQLGGNLEMRLKSELPRSTIRAERERARRRSAPRSRRRARSCARPAGSS